MRLRYIIPGPMSQSVLGQAELNRRSELLKAWAAPDVEITVNDVATGPAAVESTYDEYLGVPGCCEAVLTAERAGADGIIVGCFGDPGLDALREITTRAVVVGPGAAAFHWACLLGERIGVITPLEGTAGPIRRLVVRQGIMSALAGIEVAGTTILDVNRDPLGTWPRIEGAGKRLVDHGADVVVLACMSMGFRDFTAELEASLGVPVVNPVRASLALAEGFVRARQMHSKRAYPTPPNSTTGCQVAV